MAKSNRIPLIKVSQWLSTWENAEWTPRLPEPPHEFFIGSVSIKLLRRLAGVRRRQISERRQGSTNAGYQRAHDSGRSAKIAKYISYGYPLSSQLRLDPVEYRHLIHPGWLPTSVLVNVLMEGETRRRSGRSLKLESQNAMAIVREGNSYFINLPESATDSTFLLPKSTLEPIEIIDGQHRLFAIDEFTDGLLEEEYEVPVVFFAGLSESWQAYLFWVINVEPKKINPSLAFDLYPELRNQSWLESGEGIRVYQEHRAQELTEVLWRHEQSPWRDRIELHGNRVDGHVSNASFIRSLMSSFVRSWGKENKIGGLFGSIDKNGKERVLPWKRSQQAAFLIACWQHLHVATKVSRSDWVKSCKSAYDELAMDEKKKINSHDLHAALAGPHTLLGTDQGVRTVLYVFNAISQVSYAEIRLEEWESEEVSDAPVDEDVSVALDEFSQLKVANSFLAKLSSALVDGGIDWRTSSAPSLSPEQRQSQAAYRGSSGYSLLQHECLAKLATYKDKEISDAAKSVLGLLT
jgi:DGQHR domain-containing protein